MLDTNTRDEMTAEKHTSLHEKKVGPGYDAIHIITDQLSDEWDICAQLEFDVFKDANYVSYQNELTDEYEPFQSQSSFLAVARNGEIVGASRLIMPGKMDFKTIEDARNGKLLIDPQGIELLSLYDLKNQGFEVGTLAVKNAYRTGPMHPESVSLSLYVGITASTMLFAEEKNRQDYGFVLASFDQEYLDGFTKAFGPSVQTLGPPQMYMGSETTPVIIDVDQLISDNYSGLTPILLDLSEQVISNEQ